MNARAVGTVVAVAAAALGACHPDEVLPPATPDAAVEPEPDAMPEPRSTALVVGTDFATAGIASRITIPSLAVTQNVVAGVASTDPVVRHIDGRNYIVNRFGFDNVTILDGETFALIDQISTGAGTNPWDVAVVGNKLYVAALAAPGIVTLDMDAPDAAPGLVDLSALDPDDGMPDCVSIVKVGDLLYVACGLLDESFAARGPGRVVAIDPANGDAVSAPATLTFGNPYGRLEPTPADGELGGDLLIATVPDFADTVGFGCLERVHPGAAPTSGGCLVDNADLGGYATSYLYSGGTVWIAVSTSFTAAKLVPFDAAGGTLGQSATPETEQPTDLGLCPTGQIVAADLAGGGIRVYGPDGDELTGAALDIGQPPVITGGIACY